MINALQPQPIAARDQPAAEKTTEVAAAPAVAAAMPDRRDEGVTCAACGNDSTKAAGWSGKPGGLRYCHKRPCQRAGEDAGRITRRAQVRSSKSRVEETECVEFGLDLELLELKEIVASKIFKEGSLQGVVARRSQISTEERTLRLLVYGKFKLGERDPGGFDYVWMTVDQILECENVTQEEVDQARMAWRASQEEDWPTSLI